ASFASNTSAQEGTVGGAAGGAVTGAIVGGPVGAAVGGVAGAVLGTAVDPPPPEVITYIQEQPAPAPVMIQEDFVVGDPVPETVILTPVPNHADYTYALINERRVVIDPHT